MKTTTLFLTTIALICAAPALCIAYNQPVYQQPANAWQPQFSAPAPPPVAYAQPAPIYYGAPPVVYYAPPPPPVAYYAPAPAPYGYGYDPMWGGVNLMFSFSDSSGHDHHDHGGYYGYGGDYGYRGGHGGKHHGGYGNYGHGSTGLGDFVNGVLGGNYGHGRPSHGRSGHGGDLSQIANNVFGRHGNGGRGLRGHH